MKVLLTDNIDDKANAIMQDAGIEAVVQPTLPPEELKNVIADYDAIIVRSATKMTEDILEGAGNLRIIGRAGVGLDNIDLDAAKKMGIEVVNSPTGNINAAAEHTIALMFALSRHIHRAHAHVKEGGWNKKLFKGVELRGKRLGVVGLGKVGKMVSSTAIGLGMEVVAYDPYVRQEDLNGLDIKLGDMDDVISGADFLTVHVPLTEQTRGLIGMEQFDIMKEGVRIINAARGGVIDENALYDAITSGKVAGAALDVWESEPPNGSRLLKLDEVLATPHLGGNTNEAQINVAVDVAEKIREFLLK
jgi:D-3-phosphoglycerate dehydrogenase